MASKRPIAAAFATARRERRSAFIPYLTAGDPDLETSAEMLRALVRGGADVIELGIPFSDPIADGPVNQRSAYRALEAGTTVAGILRMIADLRAELATPIVLFTYFNPVHARGVSDFCEQAADSGVDGLLPLDLPPEEAEHELLPALETSGIDPVFLLAPTSTPERVRRVAKLSAGFVYYVSRVGVTGVQDQLRSNLKTEVKRVKRRIKAPLAVGFGISTPEQVAEVGSVADGVVVGSALVRLAEETSDRGKLPAMVEETASRLSGALRGG